MTTSVIFTDGELAYLAAQRLARLATVQPDGTVQVNPVAAYFNGSRQTLDIGGRAMASSQKFRNVRDNGRVALVFDDVASTEPWRVRCLEIRGQAEAVTHPRDSAAGLPGPIIRVRPRRVISWGIDPPHLSRGRRNVGG